ncbi:MAG: acryloyl-CoA reductase [Woeseiaceae bacterium]|nr:acryloyl-CoA reductase [Woeseiaceae bacterium]
MTDRFRAFRIDESDDGIVADFCDLGLDDLSEGDVVIRVTHSTINYKDALAATGKARILRRYPLVAGIDLAGEVVSSPDPDLEAGTAVLVNGCGLGESRDGGYAEYARVPAAAVVPVPDGMNAKQAMQIGTAGYTAALAIHRMEQNGQLPESGPIVVTGASGGVGSLAIDMAAARGYEVTAFSGKREASDYLLALGARSVLHPSEVDFGSRPMEKSRWAGAIDNVGGEALAWLIRSVGYGGNIASVGNASGIAFETTVIPFILRAVCLLGINSVDTPRDLRLAVWRRIAADLKPRHLDRIAARVVSFDELPGCFDAYIDGKVTGRTVVEIG